jgi:hypothetical protein
LCRFESAHAGSHAPATHGTPRQADEVDREQVEDQPKLFRQCDADRCKGGKEFECECVPFRARSASDCPTGLKTARSAGERLPALILASLDGAGPALGFTGGPEFL